MNIKRAKEEIKHTVEAYLKKDEFGEYRIPVIRQRPVLLMGPPGIGKTAIMEQISRELKIGLVAYTITHHTRQSAIGLPFIEKKVYGEKEYSITEYTMSEIIASVYEKIEQTGIKEGILFIDEINCVSETLAPTMLQFLQCKTFGNHKVPDGFIIVAAGNPPEYNKSVRDFDIVTLDRVKKIDIKEDYSVWREYAHDVEIHGAILSYLELKKQNFYQIETTVAGKRFVTARGWEDLSEIIKIYEELHIPVDYEVVIQYLSQETVAKDFANYLELYHEYEKDYQVKELLYGNFKNGMIDRVKRAPFDEKLSVISLLLSALCGYIKSACRMDSFVTDLFESLKECKAVLLADENTDKLSYELLERMKKIKEAEFMKKKETGFYTKEESDTKRKILKTLEEYSLSLRKENKINP
ncbi:MAG: AAA family ATPase, partial [Lachnospiraceae bacterium]|nr:AAA family ATPase [Lachnospiraceae bacterium]